MYARAKVNLTLEILGVRADGYHDIRSIVAPVSLADDVTLEPADDIALSIHASRGVLEHMGPKEDNLAFRAAQLMRDVAGRRDGVAITLVKNIPVGSGLGGGSADAAAVLNGLNEMWKMGLSREAIADIGADLGSDVPALTLGGTVLMEGRGERVVREHPCPMMHLVLAFPGVFVSTASVYASCGIALLTNGGQIVDNMRRAFSGGDVTAVAAALHNGLTAAAEALHPEIARAREAMQAAGALGVSMTGSGSCVFGLARDSSHASAIARVISGAGLTARPVHTCPVM